MKAIEQYFHVVLFIILYKMALTFQSADETPECDHSNESCWAVLSCGTVRYAVHLVVIVVLAPSLLLVAIQFVPVKTKFEDMDVTKPRANK